MNRPAVYINSFNENNDQTFWLDHDSNFAGVYIATEATFYTVSRLD